MQAGLPASPRRHGAAQPSRLAVAQRRRLAEHRNAGAQGLDGENAVIRWSDTGKPTAPPLRCPGRRRSNDQRAAGAF